MPVVPTLLLQVFYTLDVSQYAIGANENENFYHCINKALQTREPLLMRKLAGQVARVQRGVQRALAARAAMRSLPGITAKRRR